MATRALVVVVFGICGSCTPPDTTENALLAAFVESYISSYLRPTSERWREHSVALEESALSCSGLTPTVFVADEFVEVAATYEQAFRTWKMLTLARFGPFDQSPLRLAPKVDGGPVDTGVVDEAIASALTPETIREVGANRRGYPGVDYVLFNVMRRPALSQIEYDAACGYLVAATADLRFLADEWNRGFFDENDGWGRNLLEPESGNIVDDDIAALTLLIQNTGDALYVVREDVIVAPRGGAPEGELNFGALEARDSGLTLLGVDATVDAARLLLLTSDDAAAQTTIETLYASRRETARAEIEAALLAYDQARENIDGTLEEALANDLDDVGKLTDALRGLSTLVLADIMGGLGLAVSFTDADGD